MASRKFRLLTLSAAAVSQMALMPFGIRSASAAPVGGTVVAGSATFHQRGHTTIIRASNNTIIDFASFNIAAGETVKIIQPSAQARVLEEVLGGGPTTIDGTLRAKGIVYLTNPNGISFGSSAVVNVGGLNAIAGQISSSDFLAGVDHFTSVSGPISNQGQIVSGQNVFLVGTSVSNGSTISAGAGAVVLASGSDVFVGNKGSGVYAKVLPQGSSLAASVSGSGDLYSLALGFHSHIQAAQVYANSAGSTSISGVIDVSSSASGGVGGAVTVTGQTVTASGAAINASGPGGGGTIKIGGDLHGASDVPAASVTTVSPDSVFNADATSSGNGGTVVVWSDGTTTVNGEITARGAGTGNGGLVETSGHYLDTDGAMVNASSPGGLAGTWLLDPIDVTITNATTNNDTGATATGTQTFTPTASPATVNTADITNSLNSGTSVVINTTGGASDPGNITVASPIAATLSGEVSLTLQADPSTGTVIVNSPISATGAALDVNLSGSAVSINAGIMTNGGALSLNAPSVATVGTAASINVGGGAISIVTDNLSLTAGTAAIVGTSTATISPDTATTVQLNGSASSGTLLVTQADLDSFANGFSGLIVQGTNQATTATPVNVDPSGINIDNPLTINSTAGVTVAGPIAAENSTAEGVTINAGTSALSISAGITTDGGALNLTGGSVATTGTATAINVGGGAISIITDSLSLAAGTAAIVGTSTATISPNTATAVQLGGSASSGTLLLTQADLDSFAPGFSGLIVQGTNQATTATAVNVDPSGINIANPLTINSNAGVTISGPVATENGTAQAVTLNAGTSTLSIEASVTTDGGAVNLTGATVQTVVGSGSAGAISAGAGAITIDADNLTLATVGSITGTSTVTLAPINDTAVQLGGSSASGGTLLITQADLNAFAPGFTGLTVAAGANPVTVNTAGVVINQPLSIESSGEVDVFGAITTLNGSAQAINLNAGTNTLSIGANITTGGGALGITAGTVNTTIGTISVGAGALTINADNLNLAAGTASIVGTSTATISPDTATTVQLGGSTSSGTLVITQADLDSLAPGFSAVTVLGETPSGTAAPVNLAGSGINANQPFTISSTAGVNVTAPLGTENGTAEAITINTATAPLNISSNITTSGGMLTLFGGSVTTTAGTISVGAGTISITTDNLTLGAGTSSITGINTVTLSPQGSATLVQIGGTASAGTLALTQSDEDAFAPHFLSLTVAAGTNMAVVASSGININNPLIVTTSGTASVTLAGNITAEGSTAEGITFTAPIVLPAGSNTLTLTSNNGGITLGTVTGTASLLNLVSGTGATTLDGNITTAGNLAFNGPVTLGTGTIVLTATGGTVALNNTVSGTGLTTDASDTLLTSNVTTSAGQDYMGAVTLSGLLLKLSDTASTITFASTVTGTATTLTVDGAGGNLFSGDVNVQELDAEGAGTTTLAADVKTSAGQIYQNAVALTGVIQNLKDTGKGVITFGSTVNGTSTTLDTSAGGGVRFANNVNLQTLDVAGTGGLVVTGASATTTVTTTAGQIYQGPATVQGSAVSFVDTVRSITFGSTLNGSSTALTVAGAGGNFFDGDVTVQSIKTKSGATTLEGNVTTTGGQQYNQAVSLIPLSSNTSGTLTLSDTVGSVAFKSTLTGTGVALTVASPGSITFGNDVTLKSLVTRSTGSTGSFVQITDSVDTTAGQTYHNEVDFIGTAETLSDLNSSGTGSIIFDNSVFGEGTDVTLGAAFASAPNQATIILNSPSAELIAGTLDIPGNQRLTAAGTLEIALTTVTPHSSSIGNIVVGAGGTLTGGGPVDAKASLAFAQLAQTSQGNGLFELPSNVIAINPATIDGQPAKTTILSFGNIETGGTTISGSGAFFESASPSDSTEFPAGNYGLINDSAIPASYTSQTLPLRIDPGITAAGAGITAISATELAEALPEPSLVVLPVSSVSTTANRLLTVAEENDLENVGIFVETNQAGGGEAENGPYNATVIDDWQSRRIGVGQKERTVNVQRLNQAQLKRVVNDSEIVLGPGGVFKPQLARQIALEIEAYREQVTPNYRTVTPLAFVTYVTTRHTVNESALLDNLTALRHLVDDIKATGLSPAQAEAANEFWSSQLTDREDRGLVNEYGDYDRYWLLDVLYSLPGPRPPR